MPARARKVVPLVARSLAGSALGHVVSVGRDGSVLVTVPGADPSPRRARMLAHVRDTITPGVPVLLAFDDDDRSGPIIVGTVVDRRPEPVDPLGIVSSDDERSLTIDVDRLLLTLKRELVIRCGDASITIRSDGSIAVRGTDLLSRSSGSNRIKGGSVRIN